jgi:DUF971 family protein
VVTPTDIQLIGNEVAIRWSHDGETIVSASTLRAASPSASAKGEPDIFGRMHGGEGPLDFSDIGITSWKIVGNYAVQFTFTDGHRTGLYSYELLRRLGEGEA